MERRISRTWIVVAVLAAIGVVAALLLPSHQDDLVAPPTPPPVAATDARPDAAPDRPHSRRVAPTPSESEAPHGTAIVRVVAAEDGTPIDGAEVSGTGPDQAIARVSTGADGTARFDVVAPGSWTLGVSAAGRVTSNIDRTIVAGETATATVRLTRGAVLALRAEDRSTGAPIADAKVEIDVVGRDTVDHATTGDDGERLLLEPAESILRVVVSAEGHDDGATTVRLGAAGTTTPLVVRLARPGRMTGVVRAPDGSPAVGARILCEPEGTSLERAGDSLLLQSTAARARTDDTGRFVVEEVPHGVRCRACAVWGDNRWLTSEVVSGLLLAEDATELAQDFTLRAPGKLVVRVTDADGQPVAGASVLLALPTGGMRTTGTAERPGVIHLPAAPPGLTRFTVMSDLGMAARQVLIPSGGTVEVAVQLGPTAPDGSSLIVLDDLHRPVQGAEVLVRDAAGTVEFQYRSTTDASGRARLPIDRWGELTVDVTAEGLLPATGVRVADPGSDARVVLRRPAVLTFTLVGVDGRRLASESARVLVATGTHEVLSATTGNDGRFRCSSEPVGETDVCVLTSGRSGVVGHVTLAPGTETDLGALALPELERIRGRIVDSDGRAVRSALVGFDFHWKTFHETPSSGESYVDPMSDWFQVADDDGRFALEWSRASALLPIDIRADGYPLFRRWVPLDGDAPLTITLSRGGVLWGAVVDNRGAPGPNVSVRVVDDRDVSVASATTDAHGWFDVRFAAGRYVVRADGCDDVGVTVVDGGDAQIRLVRR